VIWVVNAEWIGDYKVFVVFSDSVDFAPEFLYRKVTTGA
jgi:hypothetical protein